MYNMTINSTVSCYEKLHYCMVYVRANPNWFLLVITLLFGLSLGYWAGWKIWKK